MKKFVKYSLTIVKILMTLFLGLIMLLCCDKSIFLFVVLPLILIYLLWSIEEKSYQKDWTMIKYIYSELWYDIKHLFTNK